jgi:hypothetical protein
MVRHFLPLIFTLLFFNFILFYLNFKYLFCSVGIARKVASEKGKLYTTFNQAEIQKLLVLIEQSAKALLAAGITDPTGYHNTEAVAMEG